MSPVRVASAVVCVVLAALLVLAVLPALGPPRIVGPTGGVENGPQDDLPSLDESRDVLQARTLLQRWRGVSGPAPDAVIGTPVTALRGDATPDPGPGRDQ